MIKRKKCPCCSSGKVIKIRSNRSIYKDDPGCLNDSFINFLLEYVLQTREARTDLFLCLNCLMSFSSPVFDERENGRLYNKDYFNNRTAYELVYCRKVGKTLEEVRCGSMEQAELLRAKTREQRPRLIFDLVAKYTETTNFKIIDVGGYDGHNIIKFRNTGAKLYVLDPGADIKQADLKELKSFEQAKEDGPYDLMVSTHTFEHLVAPAAELKKLKELLKPNGHFYFEVPFEIFKTWKTGAPLQEHINFFSKTAIEELFRSNGFEKREIACKRYQASYFAETIAFCGFFTLVGNPAGRSFRPIKIVNELLRYLFFMKFMKREDLL